MYVLFFQLTTQPGALPMSRHSHIFLKGARAEKRRSDNTKAPNRITRRIEYGGTAASGYGQEGDGVLGMTVPRTKEKTVGKLFLLLYVTSATRRQGIPNSRAP